MTELRHWGRLHTVLAVVVALLLIAFVVLLVRGPGSKADPTEAEYAALTNAARSETLEFLTVDYKNMDPIIARVLRGATGPFKKQYAASKVDLKARSGQNQAISKGTVREVGVKTYSPTSAVLLVAADGNVKNSQTKGKFVARYYRLQLSMTLVGGRWLLSDLEFVG